MYQHKGIPMSIVRSLTRQVRSAGGRVLAAPCARTLALPPSLAPHPRPALWRLLTLQVLVALDYLHTRCQIIHTGGRTRGGLLACMHVRGRPALCPTPPFTPPSHPLCTPCTPQISSPRM